MPDRSGGAGGVPYRNGALKAAPQLVKASAGTLDSLVAFNLDSSANWIQLFDAASAGSVTVGTTPPVLSIHIAASADRDEQLPTPLAFNNGLVIAATTTATGSTANTNGVDVEIVYN